MANLNTATEQKQKQVKDILKTLLDWIKDLFILEEVEVTFTKVGDRIKYSYTKVHHKHAA